MLAIVATLRAQDGKGEALGDLLRELASQVRANEPGAVTYVATRSRTEPNTYKVLEVYKDEDALKAHGKSDHFRAAGGKFADLLAGRPEIEQLDVV
jgi:quinol monooxygenase YgiN